MTITQNAGEFQSLANLYPAPGFPGDFATENPRRSVVASDALGGNVGLVAGSGGINAGTFAWLQSDGVTVLNSGSGAPTGFKARELDGVLSTYLASYTVNTPQGFPVTLFESGDFWMLAGNSTAAVVGQKVWASTTTGGTTTGPSGTPISGYVETPFYVKAAATAGALFIGGL